MFRPLEINIGLRYIRAKRRNHFISFISMTSVIGIALGMTTLITVLSVMNGFQKEVKDRMLGMASHATISAVQGGLWDWPEVAAAAAKHPNVIAQAPYVEGQVMLIHRSAVSGAQIRGILPAEEPKVSDLNNHMQTGRLEDLTAGRFGIILGASLASTLGATVGQKVTLVTPQANVTPAGILPRLKRLTVVGIFKVGMHEYDRSLAVLHLKDAAKIMRLGNTVSGVRLKLDDMDLAPTVNYDLVDQLRGTYMISDWTRRYTTYFQAVSHEKRMMFIILLLIVAVAAFNIVSTLIMVVSDKESDIAILRTLGMSPQRIMAIFIVQGTTIGIAGVILGLIGGVSLALNVEQVVSFIEHSFSVDLIPANVYIVGKLTADLHWDEVTKITTWAFLLTLFATFYPAWRAARTPPAQALRYE